MRIASLALLSAQPQRPGISFKFLKLGSGLMWIRPTELVNRSLGQTIPNKDFLRVRDTHRSPKLNFGMSVFDWPPFVAK